AKGRGGKALFLLLALFVLTAGASTEARAQSIDCTLDAGGLVDGVGHYPTPPSPINHTHNCTITNYTASNPPTPNISFFGPPRGLVVIFDNVVSTGNMSCDASHDNKIWYVNGSTSTLKPDCQNQLIPVEKIDKKNPPGPPVATIGVPFNWTLIIPVLFD